VDEHEESMLFRKLTALTLLATAVGLSGCSGGVSSSNTSNTSCADASGFCVASCNLGCTASGGCAITDIAQNQPLIFSFSRDVDPRSVNFTTFSLKTRNGLEPVGDFVVNGSTITFVPEVRTVQGQTFYGFDAGAEYILSLTGGPGAPAALLSTAGDRLTESYTCNLRVSRGVIDLDQQPPVARLVTPSVLNNVSRDTSIVLEFSELIDGGAFFNTSGDEAPIVYRVGRPTPGSQDCNASIVLGGVPRLENDTIRGVTIVTFRPATSLPAESCMAVEVSPRVLDLAGTRAVRQIFSFFVESGTIQERPLDFTFDNDLELDRKSSGGDWAGGEASFATLGGDGRHGAFRLQDGARVNDQHFVFSTDSQLIPRKEDSFLNTDSTVTDGRFYFTTFALEQGQILQFDGSKPVQIFVRGECRIDGEIRGNGATRTGGHNGRNSTVAGSVVTPGPGQVGSAGGPGAGSGGNGSFACDGTGNPSQAQYNSFNGFPGEALNLPAGHVYTGQEVASGGQGSTLFPAHGNQTQLTFGGISADYSIEAVSGGGGGGFVLAGGTGTVPEAGATIGIPPFPNTDPRYRGPTSPGGVQFPLLNFPATFSSIDYFLIGGSGGGGGASQAVFARRSAPNDPVKYRSAGGGAGGGGAFVIRTGADLRIGTSGSVQARGGRCDPSAVASEIDLRGVPGPGGGGSGGSILLQTGRGVSQLGTLDVQGGGGSRIDISGFYFLKQFGGDGSPGFVRLERAGTAPGVGDVGTTLPPATADNVGLLRDHDDRSGFQSLFKSTGEVFPPIFVRYEIEAVVDGVPVTFSDDPAVAPQAAIAGAPLLFYVQAQQVDPITGAPDPNDRATPWVRYVGGFGGSGEPSLAGQNARNGLRILLLIDRAQAQQVVVRNVRIVFRS
jgi:hypothetical protein